MGEHHHNHDHSHSSLKGKNLFISIALNLGISIAQTIGGILSGSIALLSDALHNFSDVLSLCISYIAHRLAARKFTTRYTFGLQRAEILAAFINSAVLMGIAIYLGFEAVDRMMHPHDIHSMTVVWLAFASIVVNGLSVLLIKSDAKKSINIKSAYLHLFTDMLTSIAVLAGGLLMKFYGIYWIDGLITLLIACYLIYSSWHLFVESINIIMLCSPGKIDIQKLTSKIESVEGVKNLHHLHLWLLTDNQINMEAHIDLMEDSPVSEFEKQLEQIQTIAHEMGIDHVTIQPEFINNDDKSLIHQHR
ncbi:MAG: cation transporter [Bacteroidales bacterium]|nr:cation transporter [Bacteroidales bacterium]